MSAISDSSMPQPTAAPLTAAITGMFECRMASAAGVRRGVEMTGLSRFSPPPMTSRTSSPEQNAGSAPVMTMARACDVAHRGLQLVVGLEAQGVADLRAG